MADSSEVRISKLRFKGEKEKRKKKSKSKEKRFKGESSSSKDDEDTLRHGGWVHLKNLETVTGIIAIEVLPHCYMRALDNGLIALGDPHKPGEGPYQEEMFTAIKISETHRALKSGFGKYLSLDANNRLVGRSDAIGQREQFEPVFQDDKTAIVGCNSCFLAPNDSGQIFATSQKAGPEEYVRMRSNIDLEAVRKAQEDAKIPEEEKGTLDDCEEKYIKKFVTGKLSKPLEKGGLFLKSAKSEGKLHEALLDRREKIKSDKFCK